MLKKMFMFLGIALLIDVSASLVRAQTSVGGDVKFYMFDISSGSSDITTLDSLGNPVTTTHDTTDKATMGFRAVHILVSSDLSERVSFDIDTEIAVAINAQSGATPSLGTKIGLQRPAPSEELSVDFNKAYVKVFAPGDVEISAGVLRPLFTEDYGAERFFQEEYHGSMATANPWLGTWHDTGIELYKSFDVQLGEMQYASIPTYLYVLNGGDYKSSKYTDNNKNKALLFHLAPEYSGFRLMGSYGFGKWDDESKNKYQRYAFGIGGDIGNFWFRGEYMGGKWEDKRILLEGKNKDIKPFGYYMKIGYQVIPDHLRALVDFSHAEHDFSGYFVTLSSLKETYTTITPSLNYFLAPGSVVILQTDIADWKNEDETSKLNFTRVTLGMRTIF